MKLFFTALIISIFCISTFSCKKDDSSTNSSTTNGSGSNDGGSNTTSSGTVLNDSGTLTEGSFPAESVSYQSYTGDNGTYQFAISGNQRVANLVVPASVWNKCTTQAMGINQNTADAADITKNVIYKLFKDDFDFIFLINNSSAPASGQPSGLNIGVARRDHGITNYHFDSSFDYMPAPQGGYVWSDKLISFMFLPYKDALLQGPSLHEICHNWANLTAKGSNTKQDPGTSIFTMDGINMTHDGHWGFSNVGGQLGGFDPSTLQSLGNNRYHANIVGKNGWDVTAAGGNAAPYAPLELYLMGLVSKSAVPNIKVFSGVSNAGNLWNDGNFTATKVDEYTIDQFITTTNIGRRDPDYTTSKKVYRGIVVVLSPQALTSHEWKKYEADINSFFMAKDDGTSLYNFWEATGKRARIDVFNLSSSLK